MIIEVPKDKLYSTRATIKFILEGDLEQLKELDSELYEAAVKARKAAYQIAQIEVKRKG